MAIRVACAQITWRQSGASPDDVLEEIRDAGYEGAPASLREGASAAQVGTAFSRRGLHPAPAYLGGDFWKPEMRSGLVDEARRYAQISRELGLTELFVSARGFDEVTGAGRTRRQAAGHVTSQDMLSDREFEELAATLNAIGSATLQAGVRSCYHNHVGSYVETEGEIERLLSLTDPAAVFLGPDSGHLAWAGIDAAAFFERHRDRILTAHLKDIRREVRERGVAECWPYRTYEQHGLWAELGEGAVDLPSIFDSLRRAGFSGWVVVETDVTQKPTPKESAVISRRYLRDRLSV